MNANDSSLPARGGAPSGMQESVSGSESRAGLLAADRSLARNQARVAGGSSMSAARNDQSRPRLLASPRKGRRAGYDSDLAGYRREQRHDSQRQRRADRCWPAPASAGEEMIGVGRLVICPSPLVSGVFPRSRAWSSGSVSATSLLTIRAAYGRPLTGAGEGPDVRRLPSEPSCERKLTPWTAGSQLPCDRCSLAGREAVAGARGMMG